ncbi:MAG TPA: DUF2231 domain-containing protein [Chloroflexota bacterium]
MAGSHLGACRNQHDFLKELPERYHALVDVGGFGSAGIITGLLSAVFGFWDWLHAPDGTRAKAIGIWQGVGNVIVVALFVVSWYLRSLDLHHLPSTVAFVLVLVAVVLALITGWLGGELVERLGVGVDEGANLNAQSSLSGKPARSS